MTKCLKTCSTLLKFLRYPLASTSISENLLSRVSMWRTPELPKLPLIGDALIPPLPISYLGTLHGGKPSSASFWSPVIEKIHRRLENWRYSYISKGGRLTLIQAILNSIPNYMLSVFRAPQSVCLKIDKLVRSFLRYGTVLVSVVVFLWLIGMWW